MESKYRIITFVSSKRDFGGNETPTFIINPPIEKLTKLKVLECHIPNSFYNFTNDKIKIREENPSPPPSHKNIEININGNFTATELCSYLSSALTAESAINGYSFVYTVSYGYDGIITFTATGDFHLENATSCGPQLGFNNFPQASGPSESGDSVAQLQKLALLVKSNEFTNVASTNNRGYYNQTSNNNVLSVVPITNDFYKVSNYHNDTDDFISADEKVFLKQISFTLTDLNDVNILLNRVPWIIKIAFIE